MMRAHYKLQRLYVETVPPPGERLSLSGAAAHYLLHVLRLQKGRDLLLFDGKNGEWRARCAETGKKTLLLQAEEQTRPQPQPEQPLIYCFAPLKQARLDYMAQKAVEMGASFLRPVISQHSQIRQMKTERVKANIIEAAEQCGELRLPVCAEPLSLEALLQTWPQQWGRAARLIFCDEAQSAQNANALPVLQRLRQEMAAASGTAAAGRPPLGLLVGPEGGFSEAERRLLYAQDFVTAMPLGSRILRADTAAVAALALIQATLGDWARAPAAHISA